MIASGEVDHDQWICPAGKCPHAVSERVPCYCPQCDLATAETVAQYAREAMMGSAEARSQTTPRFAERTFDRFIVAEENAAAYHAARKVALETSRGLALHGPPGVGKSHLAAAIVNDCTKAGTAAVYVGVEEMLARIKATFDTRGGSENENTLLAKYAKIPVLVLDDFGKESLSDWTVRTLFSLINRRYEQNLPLVMTSNFSEAQFALRKVGKDAEPMTYASMSDRINEMVNGTWLEMTGRSRR